MYGLLTLLQLSFCPPSSLCLVPLCFLILSRLSLHSCGVKRRLQPVCCSPSHLCFLPSSSFCLHAVVSLYAKKLAAALLFSPLSLLSFMSLLDFFSSLFLLVCEVLGIKCSFFYCISPCALTPLSLPSSFFPGPSDSTEN